MHFQLHAPYQPSGDQGQAIEKLTAGLQADMDTQVLLGVTGSGKTFTMANVIQNVQLPTLVITHNKTLAGQLYQEFRDFFPRNAVSYFVSYYDYYQPEAYVPQTDTYIEKETDINQEIDKLRLAATSNLLSRPDVIVVASVSCIYNLGSPVEYGRSILELAEGLKIDREQIFLRLNDLQYSRSDFGFQRSTYRVRGEVVDIYPAYEDTAIRIHLGANNIERLEKIDPLTGQAVTFDTESDRHGATPPPGSYRSLVIYPAKHYVADKQTYQEAFTQIEHDLNIRVKEFEDGGKILEAHRLKQKVTYDLEMIRELGFVNGIENYSRYFDGRKAGDAPYSLLDYFNHDPFSEGRPHPNPLLQGEGIPPSSDEEGVRGSLTGSQPRPWLCIIDESHMTIPQIRGMFNGDQARKQTLIDFGFRLPSALDNRPLRFDEFLRRLSQMVCISATPDEWEISRAKEADRESSSRRTPGSMVVKPSKDMGFISETEGNPTMDSRLRGNDGHTGVVEQLTRPTGLIDPDVDIRPVDSQVPDLLEEIRKRVAVHERVLVTTLTKRMAEELAKYLEEAGIKVQYLHSEIDTLERMDILDSLRRGDYDVVVGINLLREGLDLPEVSLVAILDADKEGFLRSQTALIQTMGRAARHINGKVIMYADKITGSMQRAIDEVNRRRDIQLQYNEKHNVTPQSISKPHRERMTDKVADDGELSYTVTKGKRKRTFMIDDEELTRMLVTDPDALTPEQRKRLTQALKRKMHDAAKEMNFELAAKLRDKVKQME